MIGGVVVGLFLLTAVFASFLANMSIREQSAAHVLAPPQRIHLFDDRRLSRPFIYNLDKHRDRETLALTYTEDTSRKYYLRFFVRGFSYRFLWVIPTDLHLFGVEEGGRLSLLGTDTLGRDLYSRLLIGGQVSLSVPFVGVGLSMLIGTILGVISGYFGGRVDHYIQRSIEILLSFPSLPLWMALAAAMPVTMASTTRYVLIVVILSLISWGALARVVRGKVLQYRGEDYVAAASMSGAGLGRIIFRHLIPGTLSHLIVSATLGIPGMILGEKLAQLSGGGHHAAADELGVAAGRRAEDRGAGRSPVADDSGPVDHGDRAGVQFLRRRSARCRRPLRVASCASVLVAPDSPNPPTPRPGFGGDGAGDVDRLSRDDGGDGGDADRRHAGGDR